MAPTDAIFATSPLAVRMLNDLPEFLTDDPDVRAVIYAQAKEKERVDGTIETIRLNLQPLTADSDGLMWWETILGIAVAPAGLTTEERRDVVMAYYLAASVEQTGLSWEQALLSIAGPGSTYAEHQPGVAVPPAYNVALTLAFPPSTGAYDRIRTLVERISPANLVFTASSADGFHLDGDELDQGKLG